MTTEKGSWGGSRPGAGNPEFKPKWKLGKTTVIRVPEAIADQVLTVARRIDQGKLLDSVTIERAEHENVTQLRDKDELADLKAANKKLYQKVGELEAALFKANHELQRITNENEEYFERLGILQLELENLKGEPVTQSSEVSLPSIDASTLFNQLRPLLNRLTSSERRAIQQKLEEALD